VLASAQRWACARISPQNARGVRDGDQVGRYGGGERRAVLEGLSGHSKGGREAGREEGGAPPSRPQLAILVAACCLGHRLQGARQRSVFPAVCRCRVFLPLGTGGRRALPLPRFPSS
jgi:hypothetical protein